MEDGKKSRANPLIDLHAEIQSKHANLSQLSNHQLLLTNDRLVSCFFIAVNHNHLYEVE